MKNSIFLIALGLILLTGCSKDESFTPIEDQTADAVYVLNQFDSTTTMESTTINELQSGSDFTNNRNSGGFNTTRGYYDSSASTSSDNNNSTVMTWFGSQLDGTAEGYADVELITSGWSYHFRGITECINVEGNKVVYGGVITEVVNTTGKPPYFEVGWRFYFTATDIRNDQVSQTLLFAEPNAPSLCGISPNHEMWTSNGNSIVREPGFVEVN